MNINNICTRFELIFSNEFNLKKKNESLNESPNENLEPLDLSYKDTLICIMFLDNMIK